jgi:hypothetical protein
VEAALTKTRDLLRRFGGGRRIRTPGGSAAPAAFKTAPINRSGISPRRQSGCRHRFIWPPRRSPPGGWSHRAAIDGVRASGGATVADVVAFESERRGA